MPQKGFLTAKPILTQFARFIQYPFIFDCQQYSGEIKGNTVKRKVVMANPAGLKQFPLCFSDSHSFLQGNCEYPYTMKSS
jgi:hypothetical protein